MVDSTHTIKEEVTPSSSLESSQSIIVFNRKRRLSEVLKLCLTQQAYISIILALTFITLRSYQLSTFKRPAVFLPYPFFHTLFIIFYNFSNHFIYSYYPSHLTILQHFSTCMLISSIPLHYIHSSLHFSINQVLI